MTMLRSSFGDLLAPGFRMIFINKFDSYPSGIEQIFNMNTSRRQYEDDSYVAGFGLLSDKNESSPSTYDDPIQGYDKRYTHTTRSLAYRVSREMWEDELYGIMGKLPAALARSTKVTIETDGANVLNRCENGSYLGGDGKTLLSTSHPLVGGGTQKNRLTNAADLNATSLEQAYIDIAETTDDRGLTLHLIPRKLVIPVELDWDAQELLRTPKDPDSANNAINPAMGFVEPVVNHFMTDSNMWIILCDEHELNWFWRIKPDHMQDNDFDTDDAKFKVRARWSNGWSIPWGVFGSSGQS